MSDTDVAFTTRVASDGKGFWVVRPPCPACGENHGIQTKPARVSTVHVLANRDAIVVPDAS